MSRLTLIVINWNSINLLSRCLENLKNQTFQDFRLLVIDNASDYAVTSSVLSSYSNASLVQNQFNLGFAAANNQVIELLENSEWVALLNPDAFPESDWLRRLVEEAENNPDYSMFSSRQLMIDANHCFLDGDGDVYHISGLVWRNGHGKHKDEATPESREVFSPCAAAALYRREALISVGGFDQDFFCYVEDVDVGFRLRLMGHRCLLVPDAVVRHIGSATSGGPQSDFAIYHGHRNLVWAYVKNMPGWLFWVCLPLHLTMNLLAVFVFVWRGKGGVILRAKRDAIKGLPKMWRKRREIQAKRIAAVGEIWRVLDKRLWPIRR